MVERSIEKDSVLKVKDHVTTELRRDKLTKEMKNTGDDETSRLFNSVHRIQQSVQNRTKDGDDDDDSLHGLGIDDQEDLKRDDAEAAMDAMQINDTIDECNDVEDEDDNIFSKNCLKDVWYQGWDLIDKMKIKATKEREARRKKQKRLIQKTVLDKVKEMKETALSTVIIKVFTAPRSS